MPILAIDIETFSEVDLPKSGVYAYVDDPSFEILLFAYAFDDEPTQIVDMKCGESLPQRVLDVLTDDNIIKTAFNAAFERTCIGKYLGVHLEANAWQCTAVQSAMLALPLSLDGVGTVLNIERKKLKEGADLVRWFSLPCRPTQANGMRTRNLPEDNFIKWQRFKEYCIRDVDAEREIRQKLRNYPIPESEQALYILDQQINDRGIMVDPVLVSHAIECDKLFNAEATRRAYELTGLENPNSPAQIKGWLTDHGVETETLDKKAVKSLLPEADGEVLEVLKLRLAMAKTSVKKYEAIQRSMCSDGRVHGLLQFYGANRTGRWAGRLVQVQNLPQNHINDLALARDLVKAGRYADLETLYESTPNVLSELIRTAFVPRPGCRFIVADFSAIEARVIAWLSGEQWRLDTFQKGGDIYCASASQMFGVPVEKHGVNGHLRQKGKIAELALGYGGSTGALVAMGALDMGLTEDELPDLVKQWRDANPHITKFWWDVDKAALDAYRDKVETRVGPIRFCCRSGMLFVTLPSGRKLCYVKPRLEPNRFNRESLTYEGVGESKKWMRIETYGPKLVENIVQATARDLLALAMLRLRDAGFDIVMHIHDEAVLEVPIGKSTVQEVCDIMGQAPVWAEGLPLRADGYECEFYKKD
ncbi:MAG: DNA polymerase [Eggerthellaceae bacterium]|nr:DNA polymerase [Eggerthellaceae bacterium]